MCVSWCDQLRSIVMCTPRYGKGSSGWRNCVALPCTKTLLASWWCAKSATKVLPRRILFSSLWFNGYNGYNWGWPSARLFGWSAADWSRPATNKSISSERKRKNLLFCWERKSWTSWLLTCCSKKGWALQKHSAWVKFPLFSQALPAHTTIYFWLSTTVFSVCLCTNNIYFWLSTTVFSVCVFMHSLHGYSEQRLWNRRLKKAAV